VDKVSHYRIVEKLGAGGMGEVYLAEDMKLGRKVAIKILSEEYTTNRDRLHRFEQEACAASALNHPNILTIHEVGNDEGRHYIATEYIDGLTLRRKIGGAQLEASEILDIAIQVASALEEAHAAGIIHRDIKPDNIMVRRNGYVKVLDFGLAKLTESSIEREPSDGEASTRVLVQTDAGVVMGTSHYMSPEQARGKPVDARSDIWSLGVVIYEMVAGRTPFEGETSTDVIVAITQKEPPPLLRFAPNVPAELDWIVTKALRKDREERYQTVKELLVDLRRLKQRLEFEAELERSVAPESFTRSRISGAISPPTGAAQALPTVEKTVSHVSSAEYIVTGIKHHKIVAGLLALVVIAATGIGAYFYTHRKPALTDKDTILLTEFINTTGEQVFEGTLKQALAVQLGQTPFLNIYPDERVRETLRFMGKPSDERITKDIGREICERQGIKALLSGSIASLGSHYVITLEALNAQSGDPIAREQIEATSKESVLSSLGTAASNLRQKLGESLSSIKKYDVKIEQATTSSLDALKAFSMGDQARTSGRTRESLPFYQKAIELDPNFAMAYARIAVFYGNQGQLELATQYVEKAFALRERVSEREKFYISEKYYNYVTGELDKSVEVQKTWASQYPNDYVPRNNLALSYQLLGRFAEAQKEAQRAIELNPTNVTARDNLVGTFIGQGLFDEAAQANEELAKLNPDFIAVHATRYLLAFLRGDLSTVAAMEAQAKPDDADAFSNFAARAAFFGKFKESESLATQAVATFKTQKRSENAGQVMLVMAIREGAFGQCEQSRRNVAAGLALDRGRISLGSAGLASAICKDTAQAQSLIDEMTKRFPRDTGTVDCIVPVIKAVLELNGGNGAAVIQTLEPVRSKELGIILGVIANYVRGKAYLQQRMGPEAAAEFEKIIAHRGVEAFGVEHVLAHLELARAAMLTGDTAKARKEYQDFLALWKDADQDLPMLIEARKEYEALK
jgi:eukaryotic-like serine/threonine-protein kinase